MRKLTRLLHKAMESARNRSISYKTDQRLGARMLYVSGYQSTDDWTEVRMETLSAVMRVRELRLSASALDVRVEWRKE